VRELELRFTNGYVTGVVAGAALDRFRAYGVNCGRFVRGRWYLLPERAAREVRRIAASLEPLHVNRTVPRSC
jgi:hypothetical protein